MRKILSKAFLMEKFIEIEGSYQTAKVKGLLSDLDKFSMNIAFDKDLDNMRTVLTVWYKDFKDSNFEKSSRLAQPIFDYLKENNEWSFFDIYILSFVIGLSKTFEEAIALVDKGMKIMDANYAHEASYWSIRFMIQNNFISRIVRAKYALDGETYSELTHKAIYVAFNRHITYVLKACNDYDLHIFKQLALLRQAIFEGDYPKIESILDVMRTWKTKEEYSIYMAMLDETLSYHPLLGTNLSLPHLNAIKGLNVRKRREELGISRAELAETLVVGEKFIAQCERGEKAFSPLHNYQLAKILGVDMNYIYYGKRPHALASFGDLPLDQDLLQACKTLSIEQKEALLATITALKG